MSITPGVINAAAPPATVQITDKPGAFSRISAMPQAQYVDINGIVEAIGNATTISADGSAISGPTPSLSSAINGKFTGIAGDVSGSSLQVVGAGLVTITGEPQESGTLYTSETTVVQGSFVQTMVTFTWQMQHGSATSTYVRVGSATGYTVGSGASGSSTIPKNVLQGYGSGLYLVDTNTGLTLASASF